MVWIAVAGEIHREGAYWVETLEGSERLGSTAKLRVTAPGVIYFRGAESPEFRYTCKLKVHASSEAAAREIFRSFALKSGRQGSSGYVTVSDSPASTELRVSGPHGLTEVALVTHGGSIDAADLGGSLRAEAGGGKVAITRIGGDVEIRTAGGPTAIGSVGGFVQCLSGGGSITADAIRGGAQFESGGGDILIRQVDGPVRASTDGGGIHIVRAGAAVTANTAGGPILVDGAYGVVTAKNSGGPIQVGHAAGARCESASGAIRMINVSGSMRASTAIGNIVAAFLAGRPALDSFLSTGAGDITVWIPSDLSVTVRAQNDASGNTKTIVSDFPGIAVRSEGAAVIAEGRINGGGPLLRLAGNGGMIFIRKGK